MKLSIAGNHVYATDLWTYPLIDKAARAIERMPDADFDRYDNPFERKSALHNKFNLPNALNRLFDDLEEYAPVLSELFHARLYPDHHRHYAGVFKYGQGDYLNVHVDAGIHPMTKQRKHVTALLYLGEGTGELELWAGTSCADADAAYPHIIQLSELIAPSHGKVVFFENNDYAWHGVPVNHSAEPRLVMTVSYLSGAVEAFGNTRERAYFVPRPGEAWDAERFGQRDLRADATRYSEVYRTGA